MRGLFQFMKGGGGNDDDIVASLLLLQQHSAAAAVAVSPNGRPYLSANITRIRGRGMREKRRIHTHNTHTHTRILLACCVLLQRLQTHRPATGQTIVIPSLYSPLPSFVSLGKTSAKSENRGRTLSIRKFGGRDADKKHMICGTRMLRKCVHCVH